MLKICITGGPYSGKSKLVEHIREMYPQKYFILIPEAATFLMKCGMIPGDKIFQQMIFELQVKNSSYIITETHKQLQNRGVAEEDIVVLYDRCVADCMGYSSEDLWQEISRGYSKKEIFGDCDYVLFFESVACLEDAEYNSKENNPYRVENRIEAVKSNERMRRIYKDNIAEEKLIVIEAQETWEKKVEEIKKTFNHIFCLD